MNEFSGRPKIQVYQENMAKGVVISEGAYNKELRNFATRKLKEFGMGRKTLEDQIHVGISEFIDFIKKREGLPVKSEEVPSAHIMRTLWSIMMTDELNAQEAEHIHHSISKMTELGPVLSELAGFMPWMEKLARTISFGHFSLISRRAKQIQELVSFGSKQMEEKKQKWARGQGQVPKDIMEMYLEKVAETTEESSPFHASQDAAKDFLADIFGAGIHTVHMHLVWMLNFVARNQEVQLKLQEEIEQVIGNENDLSRLPSLADRGQMPYADGVINEVLRMSSVMPLLLPHNTTADVRFHGYTIKKDTMIFANVYKIHFDPEIWGDPQNFRPERWFGEKGKKLKHEHLFPFSTGKRICPGEALAREQLFLYVATLFQKYSVDFDRGKVPEVKSVFSTTLHPSEFTVVFSLRKMQ